MKVFEFFELFLIVYLKFWENLIQKKKSMKESSNLSDDDDYENDDLINFQFDSKKINLSYSQLVKYS